VAIKVNLLPRETTAPARAGAGIKLPTLSLGGGLLLQLATILLVATILGLAVAGYMAWSDRDTFDKQVRTLKAENERLKIQLTELRVVEAAKREIQRRIEVIGRVAKSQGVPLAIIEGVHKAVPQGVWLTGAEMKPREVKVRVEANRPPITYTSETLQRLESKREEAGAAPGPAKPGETREVTVLDGYSIVLRGYAFNNLQVADFMENLRKIGVFSDVDFVVTQADRFQQARVFNFEVTATVKL
jgi:Tfp pilus assembly protein PilN